MEIAIRTIGGALGIMTLPIAYVGAVIGVPGAALVAAIGLALVILSISFID